MQDLLKYEYCILIHEIKELLCKIEYLFISFLHYKDTNIICICKNICTLFIVLYNIIRQHVSRIMY